MASLFFQIQVPVIKSVLQLAVMMIEIVNVVPGSLEKLLFSLILTQDNSLLTLPLNRPNLGMLLNKSDEAKLAV
jgi:hypothetical protein